MNEIRITDTYPENENYRWRPARRFGQSFEEDPKVKRAGKMISLKDFTNKNAEDTNIYEVLEKYRGDLKLTQAELQEHYNTISDDLAEIKNMSDALNLQLKAKETWNALPLDIRKEFGNNKTNFLLNGKKWADKKINDYNKLQAEIKAKQEQQAKESEVNNG